MKRTLGLALLVSLAVSPAARADHGDANLPWPSLLPAVAVTTAVQPHPVPGCDDGSIDCIDRLLARLDAQWRELDATCDHRVLFARSYYLITQGLRDDLARDPPRWFRHREWLIYVIQRFSNMYFEAYEGWEAGRPIAEPWQIAFDEAARGDANGAQDVLLASNAHTQNDLPFAYAEMGLRTPAGESRKGDHDAVNEVNTRVFDRLQDEFAARYDPIFGLSDLKPLPLDELGTIELVKVWREGAWRNAERLLAADTQAEREAVAGSIRLGARLWADAIRAGKFPGYRATRDAYCAKRHTTR